MARGKIQIKLIQNMTNRQVTFSKRRNGLFKKANELTVLCDAKVSIIMISSTGKLHEFISSSTTTKEIYDQYQKLQGVDLWSSHYEGMQENLRKLKEVNKKLYSEIRRRFGEDLNGMSFEELCGLEQDMENAVRIIRERKYKVLTNQIETSRKKYRNAETIQKILLQDLYNVLTNQIETSRKKYRNTETVHKNLLEELTSMIKDMKEDPQFGLVNNGMGYDTIIKYSNGGGRVSTIGPNQAE